jgi:hypothetical protein
MLKVDNIDVKEKQSIEKNNISNKNNTSIIKTFI